MILKQKGYEFGVLSSLSNSESQSLLKEADDSVKHRRKKDHIIGSQKENVILIHISLLELLWLWNSNGGCYIFKVLLVLNVKK